MHDLTARAAREIRYLRCGYTNVFNPWLRPGGGYSHILAIRVCAAGEGIVLFGLVKGLVFKLFGLVKGMVFKQFGLV